MTSTATAKILPANNYDIGPVRHFVVENAAELNIANDETWQYGTNFMKSVNSQDLFLLAWNDEDPARIIGLVIARRGTTASTKHTAKLRLYVTGGERSQGLGHVLISHALAWAEKEGLHRVEATPYIDWFEVEGVSLWRPETHAKLNFFEKHGFKQEGVRHNAARRITTDTIVDVAVMGWTPDN